MTQVRGNESVLTGLRERIGQGHYYEALQMYRTLYFRYSGRKRFEDALLLVHDGALTMLNHDQPGSGADLGMIVLELYETIPKTVTAETVGKALEIFKAFVKPTPVRDTFVKGLLKWSGSAGGAPARGDPRIFDAWATSLHQEGDLATAHAKFLHGTEDCSPIFATLIREMGEDKVTRDRLVARTVLQLLCLENMRTANTLLTAYMGGEGDTKEAASDPLDFARYLLTTCERDAKPLFNILVTKYKPVVTALKDVQPYLAKIGRIYFNIVEKQQQPANPMQAMMQSLMGGGGGGPAGMGGLNQLMSQMGGAGGMPDMSRLMQQAQPPRASSTASKGKKRQTPRVDLD